MSDWLEHNSRPLTKLFGPPLTIDQLQDSDRAAAAALAACPALEVTQLLMMRRIHGDSWQVSGYSNRKRKQPWGIDRGARKQPAGTEGLLRWKPEPPGALRSDEDDGVDWDKAIAEENAQQACYSGSEDSYGSGDDCSFQVGVGAKGKHAACTGRRQGSCQEQPVFPGHATTDSACRAPAGCIWVRTMV
jgi:hypothetical protein